MTRRRGRGPSPAETPGADGKRGLGPGEGHLLAERSWPLRPGGVAVLVVTILLAGACGAGAAHGRSTLGATNGAPTSAGTSSTTVRAPDRTLTASAAGSTVALSVGETLVVSLSSAGQLWTRPRSSDPAVLRSRSVTTDERSGAASATFVAKRPGAARVGSTRRCLPHPGRVCGQYVALWSVTVTVR